MIEHELGLLQVEHRALRGDRGPLPLGGRGLLVGQGGEVEHVGQADPGRGDDRDLGAQHGDREGRPQVWARDQHGGRDEEGAGEPHRAIRMRAAARGDFIRVAADEDDVGGRHADHVGGDLRVDGLVALAARLRADAHLHLAGALHQQFCPLVRHADRRLDGIDDADAGEFAARPRGGARLGALLPPNEERACVEDRRIGARQDADEKGKDENAN